MRESWLRSVAPSRMKASSARRSQSSGAFVGLSGRSLTSLLITGVAEECRIASNTIRVM